MKYIVILLFLSGCATNKETANKQEYNILVDELLTDMHKSERIELHEISDLSHRVKAQELGIAYVDYLHLINTNKNKVNKSMVKLSHINNE